MPKRTDYLRTYRAFPSVPDEFRDVARAMVRISNNQGYFWESELGGYFLERDPHAHRSVDEFITKVKWQWCSQLFASRTELVAPLYIMGFGRKSGHMGTMVVELDEERVDYIQQAIRQDRAEEWPLPTDILVSKPAARTKKYQSDTLWLCGLTLWQITPEEALHDAGRIRLLILEELDKERVKFERLQAKFSGIAGASVPTNSDPIPENVRIFVWRRDQGRCAKCGSNEKLHFDHIIPRSKGGSHTERNVQLLCETCNAKKGTSLF